MKKEILRELTEEDLKQEFDSIVKEYTRRFCVSMYGEEQSPDDFWIGDDIGGVISIGDEYWNFDQIRKTVDNNYDPKEVFAWYDYGLRVTMIDRDILVPNLDAWMKGCPRYSEEQLQKIEEQIKNTREAIDNLKHNMPGGMSGKEVNNE